MLNNPMGLGRPLPRTASPRYYGGEFFHEQREINSKIPLFAYGVYLPGMAFAGGTIATKKRVMSMT